VPGSDRPLPLTTRLSRWLLQDFGLEVQALEPATGGVDVDAQVWRASGSDGRRFAVKLTGGGSVAGLLVQAALRDRRVSGVPVPVPTLDGRLCSDRVGGRLSVLPWVSDHGALDGPMDRDRWVAFGRLLAGVHTLPVSDGLAAVLPRERHRQPRLFADLRSLDRRMAALAAEGDRGAAGDDAVARDAARTWLAGADGLRTLVDRGERLGAALGRTDPLMVVCHDDPHLGNLLMDDGSGVWLIDWDDTLLAPPETDLMFLLGGVLADHPVPTEQQGWFFEGYGPVALDPHRLAYCRCVRALVDVGDFAAQAIDVSGVDRAERAEALTIVRGVLSASGLVQLALASPVAEA
jgi:spectinomycin phosphotransferase